MTSDEQHTEARRPRWILPAIVAAQFAGTSLWFAGNAVLPDLTIAWRLPPNALGAVTSAVQLGFIAGTLVFAFFTITDRYSPRVLYFTSSLLGAIVNAAVLMFDGQYGALLALRFLTGFALAGIYPVGMRIASGWFRHGLGGALGLLVGALVLGTAFPHLLRGINQALPWQAVLLAVSLIAAIGGFVILLFVPNGPYHVGASRFVPKALPLIFHSRSLRSAAFGYFGHMWELYTFYAFVPGMLALYAAKHPQSIADVSLWSFAIIGAGSIGCASGGILALRTGSAWVAWIQLLCSGILCLITPLLFTLSPPVFLGSLLLWGLTVVGDSPQFSALIARTAPRELVGSALTFSYSIGFAITIPSIWLVGALARTIPLEYAFVFCALGPVIGIVAMRSLVLEESRLGRDNRQSAVVSTEPAHSEQ